MTQMTYEQGLRMARYMKDKADEITEAIKETQAVNYGVVALKFSNGGREMRIEILDEPFDPNVKVFPG